jgi:phosphomevalonate kinase
MSKQDRQGVRTPAELEQKYQFGKTFAEFMGLVDDTREYVDQVESSLRTEMQENVTSITRDTEQIIMSALESYSKTEDVEQFKQSLEAELSVMAERISMSFSSATEQITSVDGEVKTISETLKKYFDFGVDGMTIKAGDNAMQLHLDNDVIRFVLNGQEFGWWDGINFHTGNIFVAVNEMARFGDFAYVPRSNGSLDFLKVGG